MANKILKVTVYPGVGGKVTLLVQGRNEQDKPFALTSAPCSPSEVSSKLSQVANEFDLSAYPYDHPVNGPSLGSF